MLTFQFESLLAVRHSDYKDSGLVVATIKGSVVGKVSGDLCCVLSSRDFSSSFILSYTDD